MAAAGNNGQASFQLKLCWALTVLWAPLSLYSVTHAYGSPAAAWSGGAQGLLLMLIMALHGGMSYGWKGCGAFAGAAGIAVFLLEACSIATGFPFGSYHHQGSPGPAPLGVPVSVIVGCVVLAWFSWALARLVTRRIPWQTTGFERFVTPVIGAFIYAGFDLPIDPIGATVRQMWVYHHPGGQLGVPLTNFLGWIFTGWVSLQLFALIEHRFAATAAVTRRTFWLLPIVVWLAIALQYPIMFANAPEGTVELGASRFVIAHIFEAAIIGSLFSMIFVVLIALARLGALGNTSAR
jgi:putative membrane protein